MATPNKVSLISALALKKGLDPAAVLAVARQEGLGGGVGDQGTSFGPFQLHIGGAFPRGVSGDRNAWAWSPSGLNYALSRIASVASGLHGAKAVNAIVRRFERPANPNAEVSGALSSYGNLGQLSSVGNPGYTTPLGSTAAAPFNRNLLLKAVLAGQTDLTDVIRQEYAGGTLGGAVSPPNATVAPLGGFAPAELLREGTGGPTHSTGPHIHVAYTNPQAVLSAIRLAQSLGLHVGENPYVGSVAPVHAQNSYHYRTFPGKYNGRRLGEAIDVSGPKMQQFYSMLLGRSS